MSSKIQSTINFSVRKSSRTTNRVNYNEKVIQKCDISEADSKTKTKSKLRSKSIESIETQVNEKKSPQKTRARKQSHCNDNHLDENEDKLRLSPNKIKKTSEVKQIKKSSDVKRSGSSFFKAKQLLSPSNVDLLVGRDSECLQIREWVTTNLKAKQSASLYISGSAGTGKTLSVSHVMTRLKESFDFKLISINCMTFRNSNSIYNKILNEFKHKKVSKQSNCLQAINELLTDQKSSQMIVLILDELDQLDTKSHDVLNTIFLWTKASKSKLILIGIANALDLTTRILSRIKALNLSNVEEMHFMPYETNQIISIIEERIRRASDERNVLISPLAIQLCAQKIGSCSGDIRKALDVCRRAIELVENNDSSASNLGIRPLKASNDDGFNIGSPKKNESKNNPKCVDFPQIMSVLNQVYGQKFDSQSKRFLPFNQQIILCALLLFSKHKNLKEVKLSECHQIFVKICSKRGISYNGENGGEFLSMCQLLEDYGFVSIKRLNQNIRNSKLSLRVDDSEIEHSLSDTQFLNSILQNSTSYFS